MIATVWYGNRKQVRTMNSVTKPKTTVDEDRHCSLCKYYQCVNFFMFCTKLRHRIKASRKNGCKHFVRYY